VRPRQRATADETGQGTVEWIALVLLVSLLAAVLGAAVGIGLAGAEVARAIASRLVCAVGLAGSCDAETTRLTNAYGDELAALVSDHAPTILYEPGMRALPVDYRRCREDACAEGPETGEVWRSRTGEPTVAFVRVIDCRPGSESEGATCSARRAGNIYLQYWLYYPGSATGEGSIAPGVVRSVSSAVGKSSYHPDDWESYQLRIGADGRFGRASAHHGYGDGWAPEYGGFRVSGGSHAGMMAPRDFHRTTPGRRLRLIPLEPIAARQPRVEFAITPPWRKRVWRDPEYEGTD
jgi:uncharacterized membrane protein